MIKPGFVNVVFYGCSHSTSIKSPWVVYETDNITKHNRQYLPSIALRILNTRRINKERNKIELDKYRYSFDCLK